MSKLKRKILNIIFWVALAVGIIMVLWRIFGESPTDLVIITPFIIMLISKIWDMNETIRDVGHQVKILSMNTKYAFDKVKNDFENLNKKSKK